MENEKPPIPFRMTQLIVGFLHHTLTAEEHTELDDWITASDGTQQAFEACLEMSQRAYHRHPDDEQQDKDDYDNDDSEIDISYLSRIADLIFKHLQNTITPAEQLELEEWRTVSVQNNELFAGIPRTGNIETLFAWVFNRYWQKQNGSGLN